MCTRTHLLQVPARVLLRVVVPDSNLAQFTDILGLNKYLLITITVREIRVKVVTKRIDYDMQGKSQHLYTSLKFQ